MTTATVTTATPFPADPGQPVWQERRSRPVVTLYGVPAAFLAIAAVAGGPPALRVVLGLLAVGLVAGLIRARRRALIETYALSERYLTISQPQGGRVAIRVGTLTAVTLEGDRVRFQSTEGRAMLGFVRNQRALVRALAQVAPTLAVERDGAAFCPT